MNKLGMTKAWVKRGDFHTMHKEDVTYVRHPEEAQEVVQEYFLRGIKRAVVSRHIEGELLKFYGVYGTPWFYCFYHHGSRDKQAMDEDKPSFDHEAFKEVCTRAAEALDIKIYGGDAIILPDGLSQSLISTTGRALPLVASRLLVSSHVPYSQRLRNTMQLNRRRNDRKPPLPVFFLNS